MGRKQTIPQYDLLGWQISSFNWRARKLHSYLQCAVSILVTQPSNIAGVKFPEHKYTSVTYTKKVTSHVESVNPQGNHVVFPRFSDGDKMVWLHSSSSSSSSSRNGLICGSNLLIFVNYLLLCMFGYCLVDDPQNIKPNILENLGALAAKPWWFFILSDREKPYPLVI